MRFHSVVSAWLLLLASSASAQTMVEVPNDPERMARLAAEDAQLHPLLLPAPSASRPTPPPIVVPPPSLRPSQWRVEPRYALLYWGGCVFSGVYASNAGIGYGAHAPALMVPIVGPALELATLSHQRGFLLPEEAFLVLDLAIQAGSAGIALATLFSRQMVWRPIKGR